MLCTILNLFPSLKANGINGIMAGYGITYCCYYTCNLYEPLDLLVDYVYIIKYFNLLYQIPTKVT